MTAIRMTQSRRRLAPIAAHAYTLPVVRELPRPLVDAHGSRTW
jgi:hypothetical protein